MNAEDLRAMIRDIVQELLLRPAAARRALVAFTGSDIGYDESLAQLDALRREGFALDCVATDAAAGVLDLGRARATGLTPLAPDAAADHPLLIIPTLSTNTAAKAATLIADTRVTNLIAEFLLTGRPVVAVRCGACPDSAERLARYPHAPEAFKAAQRRNLQALASYGVRFTEPDGLRQAVLDASAPASPATAPATPVVPHPATPGAQPAREQSRLISHRTIDGLPPGFVLRIGTSAIVTSLARDTARERAITIERG